MASVPITVLLYDGPLRCGFNVAIKGLIDELSGCVGWSTQQFSSLCVVWTSSDKSSAND